MGMRPLSEFNILSSSRCQARTRKCAGAVARCYETLRMPRSPGDPAISASNKHDDDIPSHQCLADHILSDCAETSGGCRHAFGDLTLTPSPGVTVAATGNLRHSDAQVYIVWCISGGSGRYRAVVRRIVNGGYATGRDNGQAIRGLGSSHFYNLVQ